MNPDEREPGLEKGIAPDASPEKASDMELALFLGGHIDNPCSVEVAEGQTATLRESYIQEAKKQLTIMTDATAKEFLKNKIRIYEKDF